MLLKRDPANPAPAEEAFLTAIAVAKQQGTRSFELRAALSLAKLYQSTGRPADAHAVLAPALEGFSPTPEMPEIAEAQALLASAGGDRRGRRKAISGASAPRSHLQTVLWPGSDCGRKGFAAEETRTALARVGELESAAEKTPGRFVAYFAAVHEQLHAGRNSPGARNSRDLPERSRGRRANYRGWCRLVARSGLVLLFQGDFGAARTILARVFERLTTLLQDADGPGRGGGCGGLPRVNGMALGRVRARPSA